MANISKVNLSGSLYSLLKRRDQRPSESEEAASDTQLRIRPRDRRHLADRRRRQVQIRLERRNRGDRRQGSRVSNRQDQTPSTGGNINTTA